MRTTKRSEIKRDKSGVPHVVGRESPDLFWGLGYCHAMDRGMQMLLMRVLGEGRASEHLDSSDEMLKIDLFFRRMKWNGQNVDEAGKLGADVRPLVQAYIDGINARLAERTPWEYKLLGYKPAPWRIEDTFLISRMVSYLTLAQSQAEVERLLLQFVKNGIERAKLEELFKGNLNGLDEELVRKLTLLDPLVPDSLVWNSPVARMMASNNWVCSGSRTRSGKPILANDPHLEANRLPNVWYEIVWKMPGRFGVGATIPGVPGILIGRTSDVAWGATYSFMDAVDSWIEHCKDGKYRREQQGEQWLPFRERREKILRKKKPAFDAVFYENEHGVLEGDPWKDEYCLATRWSGADSGAASVNSIARMWPATNLSEAMELLGTIETAFNWVIADRHGSIGFQMSGLMPKRRDGVSGLVPLPGWKSENDWKGYVPYTELPSAVNPPEGFFVTANNDLNRHGKAKPINMPMGDWRANRIEALLSKSGRDLTVDRVSEIQYDVVSHHAEMFMKILRPLIPETDSGRALREWDYRYESSSQGAYLFERVYRTLLEEVFGANGLGESFDFLVRETGIFVDFYSCFDRVLLSEKSAWFGTRSRQEIYQAALSRGLSGEIRPWGDVQKIVMTNILFAGKLPRVFGFDRGPIPIRGGRATVHQGQIYRSAGRNTSFVPSFRMILDLGEDAAHTNLAGGPSDRRFSKWYNSDTQNWLNRTYKKLQPN